MLGQLHTMLRYRDTYIKLSEKEGYILWEIYFNNYSTMAGISEELGITIREVKELHKSGLKKLGFEKLIF